MGNFGNCFCAGVYSLFLVSSCTTNKLLFADFEGETVGRISSQSLPGEPRGDQMDLYIDSQGHYIIEEETNGMPPETTKWLRINGHVPSDLEPKSATFKPVGATMETPTYTVLWAGSIEFPTDRSKPLHVKLWSRLTGGQLYFSLNYRKERHNGTDVAGIYMIENGGPLSGERIGWVPPGVRQSITIFINTENRTMTITGNGIPENIVKPIPERITDMRAPMVSMGYYEIGIGAFRLDNISIIESKKREEE